ncbi:MAG: hypothetical protein IJ048_10875, partial [Clostridia bacterium]|nr:hypothetical protein [Clostridia bacterium]
ALVVFHAFGGSLPKQIALPVGGGRIAGIMASEPHALVLNDGALVIDPQANFEALAVHLVV